MKRRTRLKTGNEGWLTSYADLITNLLIFFMLILMASEVQMGKLDAIASSLSAKASPKSLAHAEKSLKQEITQQQLEDKVDVKLTSAGLELSFNSGLTFASGGAEILPQWIDPLKKVLGILKPYSDRYRFAVEGHTDETPFKNVSVFSSNWDLAAARALQVRQYLESVGIPRNIMRVEAYADTKKIDKNTLQGLSAEAVLAKHRRVIIRIY